MQHQQPAGGGGGGPQSLGGYGGGAAEERVMSDEDQKLGDLGIAEAASPISSRPPALGSANFEEMIQATAAEAGGSSSNRWPRQETLALLQIRSEMDTAFRDATLKGPLWDQVSRKLGELGYKRSAKKCKEKFENVHKYYKRTKEGRGGRQDGKSYKFFSQLEALHRTTATASASASAAVLPRYSTNPTAAVSLPPPPPMMMTMPQPEVPVPVPTDYGAALFGNVGISFSSDDEESSSDGEDHDEDEEMETADNRQRKRKRSHGGEGEGGDERMMEFFEGLLKQVMQKQEAMQQRFLEAIEKREQDRMIREEAWKRQDMARIAREHDLIAQERATSASRDAAIIDFLQKLTGQTIQLPAAQPPPPPQTRQQQHQPRVPSSEPQAMEVVTPEKVVVEAAAETDIMGGGTGGNAEASSSRWPKAEVLALIKLRSGMEAKYQEAGPKGPLWEEISAGMGRMGYKRSSKRCKEKWENINKYFKKVKESNKKRPQDAKTCPYFNELDALYRKKLLGNTTAEAGAATPSSSEVAERKQQEDAGGEAEMQTDLLGGEKQPEDMLNKGHQQIDDNYCNNSIHSDEDEDYEEVDENDDEYDDKTEEDMKMAYKIQFQRQNGGTGTTSSTFVAMVQ